MPLPVKVVRRGRVPQAGRAVTAHLSAPVGGINTISPASAMPETDCIFLYNMIPFQRGLRVRSGYREWARGMQPHGRSPTGLYDNGSPLAYHLAGLLGGPEVGGWVGYDPIGVRSVLAFTGSASDGSNDRLWGVTDEGIWDITASTTTPALVFAFSYQGFPDGPPGAGRGVGCTVTNIAGDHFYAYCDGAHGFHLYSERTQAWTKITTSQVYSPDPLQPVDPDQFRFVMQWKNRLWFAVENSATAWYLDVNAVTGPAYPMPMAPRFKSGGDLVGLWSWTIDGGTGIDDHLVAISRGGDVVIYSGTDPALPGAFNLRGVWWVGQPPPGRRIASNFGGDLFILSIVGCVPLSKLVSGGLVRDPEIMASAKVANLFNHLMTERGYAQGWCIAIHPTDNIMVINVPAVPGTVTRQLTMSLANLGWSEHVGVPMTCMETWRNKLYFGTSDGRVCTNEGYFDDYRIGATSVRPIDWALLTSFQNLGTANQKRIHMIRPHFMTDGTSPGVRVGARFNFDMSPLDPAPVRPRATPSAWDSARWDIDVWDDSVGAYGKYAGATGMGAHVAISMRGSSLTSTTFVGFDVVLEGAGIL